ncbi:acyl-ACP desaturase [Bacillus sp. MRMR6]|uniref:acyl-ACP desaturase n=1 Tax=Bacillus sp. MRMR6 TaxID=1928617 RepID=UPI0009526D2D|nr:acyl-ACP desaturase [Bacillus sp. MRMR6]OLS40706.1 acyl-ACP desaturase [Bacillus sp. MRMR6]
MLSTEFDDHLETKITELYRVHKERSAKIDWSYHEFIPWDKAMCFKRVPWDKSQVTLPENVIVAVETALLTEVNLPWYTTHLYYTFHKSMEVLKDFIKTWTAEEDQHSNLLETYLLVTRNVDPERLHQLRKSVVENGWTPDFTHPIETMAYTTLQELATLVFYSNVAKVASPYDKDLATLLRRLAKDESLHYAFYRDTIKAHLDLDPNLVMYLDNIIMNFSMPGAVMPDFSDRMKIIANEANYGPLQYFDQVLDVIVEYWDIENLKTTTDEAKKAQSNILTYHKRLKRIRDRFVGSSNIEFRE